MVNSADTLYMPRAGSLAHRVAAFFVSQPEEELTSPDVMEKFGGASANVFTMLKPAVASGLLAVRREGNSNTYSPGPRILAGEYPEAPAVLVDAAMVDAAAAQAEAYGVAARIIGELMNVLHLPAGTDPAALPDAVRALKAELLKVTGEAAEQQHRAAMLEAELQQLKTTAAEPINALPAAIETRPLQIERVMLRALLQALSTESPFSADGTINGIGRCAHHFAGMLGQALEDEGDAA